MSIFNPGITLAALNGLMANTMVSHLGIEFTAVGDDFLEARMPVDQRTKQPYGLLHGGASVALAETMGSVASAYCVPASQVCVGLDINANHIRAARDGFVTGIVRPLHRGKSTHVWEIKITNEKQELICVSRITMAVIEKK